jgi:membrane-bound lytic murein transglycosylase B
MNKIVQLLIMSTVVLAGCQSSPDKTLDKPMASATPALPVPVPEVKPPVEEPVIADDANLKSRKEQFIVETAKKYAISEGYIRETLAKAEYKQSIVNAMSRPAEATKTWAQYRPIFITDGRISQGRVFLSDNSASLEKITNEYGVPSEIIVSIMGVETGWGGNMGSHRVLDALYTLAFYYPVIDGKFNSARTAFFTDELSQFFALCQEEGFDILDVKGSYAGAMGLGQFMPSSYRKYAKDGDGDGKRNLFTSKQDAFASIANYFIGFGWQTGKPTFVRATENANAVAFKPENWEANYSLKDLQNKGYVPNQPAPNLPVTLLTLEGAQGAEYWIGYKNFWVITRYNRSPMYAMSVFQLSQEIAQIPY